MVRSFLLLCGLIFLLLYVSTDVLASIAYNLLVVATAL
jgi:hypothetical protein